MITTIIPYLLLANLPNWDLVPEYIYSLDINVLTEGPDTTHLYPGVNVDNEVKCRPKEADVLSCTFRHTRFEFFNRNLTTGKVIKIPDVGYNHEENRHEDHAHYQHRRHAGHEHVDVYNQIPFELKFDKTGVKSMVMSASAAKDIRGGIVQSVANLLSTGTDLSNKMPSNLDTTKTEELVNMIKAKCMGEVQVTFASEGTYSGTPPGNVDLNLAEPLPTLNGRKLHINIPMKLNNCPKKLEFWWAGLIEKHLDTDTNLKYITLSDDMTISNKGFTSGFAVTMETISKGHPYTITENMKLQLIAIRPTDEEMPQIANPTTVQA